MFATGHHVGTTNPWHHHGTTPLSSAKAIKFVHFVAGLPSNHFWPTTGSKRVLPVARLWRNTAPQAQRPLGMASQLHAVQPRLPTAPNLVHKRVFVTLTHTLCTDWCKELASRSVHHSCQQEVALDVLVEQARVV
jgi:hypothetical protein